jgi:GNAT superfamily N-acetyltransferase
MRTFSQWLEGTNPEFSVYYEEDRGWYYINLYLPGSEEMVAQLTWTVSEANIDKVEELELYYIWIDPKYRRQGVGEYLLKLFKTKAKQTFPTADRFASDVTWMGVYNLLNKVFGIPELMKGEYDDIDPKDLKLRKSQPKSDIHKLDYKKSVKMIYAL